MVVVAQEVTFVGELLLEVYTEQYGGQMSGKDENSKLSQDGAISLSQRREKCAVLCRTHHWPKQP